MSVVRSVRTAVSRIRERPATRLAGIGSAIATVLAVGVCITLFRFLASLDIPEPEFFWELLWILTGIVLYDVALVVTKPAILPGLYALTRGESGSTGLRDVGRVIRVEARSHYRAVFTATVRARISGLGYSLLCVPLALTGATALSLILYATGTIRTPDPMTFGYLLVLSILLVRVIGTIPVTFTELLTIDGDSPSQAWLTSARLVRQRPRLAGGIGLLRVLLGCCPFVVLIVYLQYVAADGSDEILVPLSIFAFAAVFTKTVEAAVHVEGYESVVSPSSPLESSDRRGSGFSVQRLRPSKRTALAILLVLGLGVSSGVLRVTDVRPNAEAVPEAIETDGPKELYTVAVERTANSSRTVRVESHQKNWTQREWSPRWRSEASIDYTKREAAITSWSVEDGSWERFGELYVNDGVYATNGIGRRAHMVFHETEVDQWSIYASPDYVTVKDRYFVQRLPDEDVGWMSREHTDGTLVLESDEPAVVKAQSGRAGYSDIVYEDGSRVEVHIDQETQRLTKMTVRERYVVYEDDERTEIHSRVDYRRTFTYDYDVAIDRPAEIGFQPARFFWDLLYY